MIRGLIGVAAAAVLAGGLLLAWVWSWTSVAPADVVTLYGNVDIRDVALAFNESDRIAQMLVKEGDRVRSGQLLATLDTRRLEAARARAEAQVG